METVMGFLEDVVKVLDRIPVWKRLQGVPAEVDDLKARVAALEEKLGGKWPGDVCRYCGARAVRLSDSTRANDKGIIRETWHCTDCDADDMRSVKAK